MFVVESADGQRFHVGCDCIRKVDDQGGMIRDAGKFADDVKRMKKDREAARIAEAKANLPQAHALRNQPHPNAWHASEGKTLAHYCEWLFANSGTAGRLRGC